MSVSRPPAIARASPAHIDRSVTSSSAASSAEGSPTVTVTAESLCQPCEDGAAVDGDVVALGQPPLRVRDAVHDLVVDRGADRAGEAVVAEEVRAPRPCERMWSSAIGVELAGADARADGGLDGLRSRRPSTSPEARISSISCAVLIWIMRPLHFASSGTRDEEPTGHRRRAALSPCSAAPGVVRAQRLQGPGGDLLDLTDRVDAGEQARPARRSPTAARSVPGRPPAGAGRSRACRRRAAPSRRRRASGGRTAGGPARPRRRRARGRGPARCPSSASDVAQLLGLGDGAREAVEQEPGLGVGLGQPVLDHGHGDLVGNEVAGVHVGLGLLARARSAR